MTTDPIAEVQTTSSKSPRLISFRRAIFRGLGIVLPPLLTIVLLIWAWNTIENYVLRPIESWVRSVIVLGVHDTLAEVPPTAIGSGQRLRDGFTFNGTAYVPDPTQRRFIPDYVKRIVDENAEYFGPTTPAPASANSYWHRFVELQYMPRKIVLPIFLLIFTTTLYFLGRLFTHGIGRWLLRIFDAAILRIPVINKVYGSVKQITDFAFDDREMQFNKVVALEYPCPGIWSLGFVTGPSIQQLTILNGEEMLSILMPTSPMPMTGYTINVARSKVVDMDLTMDEALQFIVSCGVVVPEPKVIVPVTLESVSNASAKHESPSEISKQASANRP
jgi:uncharacterized membrane protein